MMHFIHLQIESCYPNITKEIPGLVSVNLTWIIKESERSENFSTGIMNLIPKLDEEIIKLDKLQEKGTMAQVSSLIQLQKLHQNRKLNKINDMK